MTTVYFNNKAFKRSIGAGSNFYDIETGDQYWISGVKRNGEDRHWAGRGKISIDRKVVDDYVKIIGGEELNMSKFEIVEINEVRDKNRFLEIENQ